MNYEIYKKAEDLVRERNLKTANRLREEAGEQGDITKYEQAAFYYEAADKEYLANVCRMAADVLRR